MSLPIIVVILVLVELGVVGEVVEDMAGIHFVRRMKYKKEEMKKK
jgi:hypothetical protein